MLGQGSTVGVPRLQLRLRRINRLIFRMHGCNCRLDVFQSQLILIWVSLLRLGAKQCPLEVRHKLFQPDNPLLLALDDGIAFRHALFCGLQKRLQCSNIRGKIGG